MTITPQDMERQIRELQERLENIESMLMLTSLHIPAKERMIKAIKKRKRFSSKRQWARYAGISMDTFYRLEKEVIDITRLH